MSIYKIFMFVTIPILVIGWIAYWWWMRKTEEEEKNQPRQVSKRLTQTKSEVSDWAKKMAEYKPPKRKFEDRDADNDDKG